MNRDTCSPDMHLDTRPCHIGYSVTRGVGGTPVGGTPICELFRKRLTRLVMVEVRMEMTLWFNCVGACPSR